ncbi:MAG: DUF885 domain-containing protein [Acidimicrobiales bacterium]|nr:DUF885 domain-containing protein [Acidimicrobiales bacterium]
MANPRQLAERFHEAWLQAHPFAATTYGIPGYDDRVPDASEAGDEAWRGAVQALLADAGKVDTAGLPDADAVTLECLVEHARQQLADLDSAPSEHTVTAMPLEGPPELLSVAARTVLPDRKAAADYLARLRASGVLIDQQSERLRIGAAKGRLPVAPLVQQAITWAEGVLRPPVPEALTIPRPPDGWDGEGAWRDERDAIAAGVVKPALARWLDLLKDLADRARPAERPGLVYLPDGEAEYTRAIRSHTTLALSPEQLHQTGLDEIAALEARALALGRALGLDDLPAIHRALRRSSTEAAPDQAMAAALRAIRRAEAHAGEVFPAPLPPACDVTPMPAVVAVSGMAPHYTPPRLDGGRPGTFWFNTEVPTAGTGWDLECVAFHEAVPGHHLQLSRVQMLGELPDLQRLHHLTVFGEGWGLYAEQLAEEMGLYHDNRSLLGAIAGALMRAARLVVDTGLHAFGWSRDRALELFVAHVPMPEAFLATETDRYIAWPGQALAYLTGKLEILSLREEARARLGPSFSLPEFHSAVLDSGSLPMPVLRHNIERWTTRR